MYFKVSIYTRYLRSLSMKHSSKCFLFNENSLASYLVSNRTAVLGYQSFYFVHDLLFCFTNKV